MYGEVLLEVPSAEIGEMDESHSVPELGKAATQALAGSSVVGSVKGHVEVVTLHQLPHLVPVLEAVGGGREGHLDPSPAPRLRHVLHRHEHVATPHLPLEIGHFRYPAYEGDVFHGSLRRVEGDA